MRNKRDEILSKAELRELLIRNNEKPELGRPIYKAWSDNRGTCMSQTQLNEANRRANLNGPDRCFQTWVRRLNSKRWRINKRGADSNQHRVVTRPIRTLLNGQFGWTEVELNSRRGLGG